MKLSNNFQLQEFLRSETANKLGIINNPNSEQEENLRQLCIYVLQPLREKHGKPLIITSGFRCQELNKAVGGIPTSQHTKGQAADVHCAMPRKLLSDLLNMDIEFDQAILYATFLHISYNHQNNRKQVLYAKGIQP